MDLQHIVGENARVWPISLTVDNLSYRHILDDVSLHMASLNMVGLLGPNGAGKSTFLRMITGVWSPTAGEICIDGISIQKMSPRTRARYISYLPQHIPEQIMFTVEQYVEMGRYVYSTPFGHLSKQHRDVVRDALTLLELTELRDVRLCNLSGGEQQRAGIARCLAQGSRILVLDEPTSSLDLHHQVDILGRLRDCANRGYLVVLAIHNLELAARYCTHLVLMDQGKLYSSGAPNEVLTEQAVQDVFRIQAKTYNDPYSGFWRLTHVE